MHRWRGGRRHGGGTPINQKQMIDMNGPTFAPPDPSTLFTQSAERFTKFWSAFTDGMGGLENFETPTPDSMRKMRGAFLNSLAASYDEYLRSPEFTKQLSQMLQQGVKAQQRMAEMLGQTQSAWQASSRQDVDAMMQVMQRLERRIGDGFARLDERVRDLESAVERQASAEPEKKKAAVKQTAPRAARPAAKKTTKKVVKKAAGKATQKSTRKK
jgi:hypothetical protein